MSEIYRRILAQYGEHCMAKKNVHEWVDRLKCGKTTLDNDKQSGWPSTYRTYDHGAEVDAPIKENRLLSVKLH
jgi:hypothetical protein